MGLGRGLWDHEGFRKSRKPKWMIYYKVNSHEKWMICRKSHYIMDDLYGKFPWKMDDLGLPPFQDPTFDSFLGLKKLLDPQATRKATASASPSSHASSEIGFSWAPLCYWLIIIFPTWPLVRYIHIYIYTDTVIYIYIYVYIYIIYTHMLYI